MTSSEKFSSDLKRIKKMNRSESGFDMQGALKSMESLFVAQNSQWRGLALSLFSWWKEENARGPELEDAALEKLCAVQAFLSGEEADDSLDQNDWQRIREEVGYEAENIPLDALNEMMKTVVERGGMN